MYAGRHEDNAANSMVAAGMNPSRVSAASYGELEPVAGNDCSCRTSRCSPVSTSSASGRDDLSYPRRGMRKGNISFAHHRENRRSDRLSCTPTTRSPHTRDSTTDRT